MKGERSRSVKTASCYDSRFKDDLQIISQFAYQFQSEREDSLQIARQFISSCMVNKKDHWSVCSQ